MGTIPLIRFLSKLNVLSTLYEKGGSAMGQQSGGGTRRGKLARGEGALGRRSGRPPKAEGERKASHITFRVRENLRERLQRAAEENGRSLSEETEYRLESTFRDQDVALRALGGPKAEAIVAPILLYLGLLERQKIDWVGKTDTNDAVQNGIKLITDSVIGARPLSHVRKTALILSAAKKPDDSRKASEAAIWVLSALGLVESAIERKDKQ
jgi:hypothetical protein